MFYITINSLLFPSTLIGDRNKTLTIREYLNEIRPYLKDIINNLQKPKYMENSTRISNQLSMIKFIYFTNPYWFAIIFF